VYASWYAFRKIIDRALADRDNPKHIVFFVHGFNNALEDVVLRCDLLVKTYGVEVVAFSWPANGGGIRGVASYLDDKRDLQASVVAFDRAMDKARQLLVDLRASAIDSIVGEAKKERGVRVNSERFRERVGAIERLARQPALVRQHRHLRGGRQQRHACRMDRSPASAQPTLCHHQRR